MHRILGLQNSAGSGRILRLQNAIDDQVVTQPVGQTVTDEQYAAWLDDDDAVPNILIRVTALVNGVATVFRWSTLGVTFGGVVDPVYYAPLVSPGIPFAESLSLTGGATIKAGDLEIDNTNAINQHLLGYDWKDQPIEALEGDLRWNEADYRRIYKGVAGGMSVKTDRTLALYQLDMTERLNTAMTEHKLGGAGPNQDAIIPIALGESHNVSGLLISEGGLTRSFNDGPIKKIVLRTNALPTADFDVDYAAGTVELGVNNQSATITASIQGDNFGGVYRKTIASLVRRIVTGFGDAAKRCTDADLDLANFAAFDAAHPEPVGDFISDRVNVIVQCDKFASSIGARLCPSIDGKLRLIQIAIPASGVSTDIRPEHILLDSLKPVEHIPRVDGIKLNFCRNYTVQKGLLSSIPDEHKDLFGQEWLSVTVGAGDPTPRNTQFLRRVDAKAQALRDFALWGVNRDVYEFIGLGPMRKLRLGQPATIYNELFGMGSGVECQVISLAPDYMNRRVTVRILV